MGRVSVTLNFFLCEFILFKFYTFQSTCMSSFSTDFKKIIIILFKDAVEWLTS